MKLKMPGAAAMAILLGGVLGGAAKLEELATRRRRSAMSPTHVGRGPGWSHAHVKRMAAKRRNVLRNRRAQKRAGR